jgi:hypothetical protein
MSDGHATPIANLHVAFEPFFNLCQRSHNSPLAQIGCWRKHDVTPPTG